MTTKRSTTGKAAAAAARKTTATGVKPRVTKPVAGTMTDDVKAEMLVLLSSELITVAEICRRCGVTSSLFMKTLMEDATFAAAVADAKRRFGDMAVVEAKKALLQRVTGFDYVETATTYVNLAGTKRVKEIKEITKKVLPDVSAIIFTLTNYAGDEFRNTLSERGALPSISQKEANEFAAKFLQGLKANE